MKAYRSLVKYALAKDMTVSVWDGEEWQLKRSTGFKAIIEAIESVEVAELRIRDINGSVVAWAQIIPFGLEDDETVSDYTDNAFMNEWDKSYA
jgi:hypothetical protein